MRVCKQDAVTFLIYVFVCIWNSRTLAHSITTYERLLYLSNNGTNDSSNDCTDSNNPCTLWSQITGQITSGDIVFIDKGNYDAPISLDIDSSSGWTFENYTIIGSGTKNTVIEFSDQYETLFNFDGSSANVSNFKTYDLTYYPVYGSTQEFGYFEYMTMVDIRNITMDDIAKRTNYSWHYDLIGCYYVDSMIVENVQIKDLSVGLFMYARYHTHIAVKNIMFATTNDTAAISMFLFVYADDSDVRIENVVVRDYYLNGGVSLFFDDHSNVSLNNITFNGVSGDKFFYFDSCYNVTMTMSGITIKNSEIDDTLMHIRSSRGNESILIEHSVIDSLLVNSDAVAFDFESYSYSREGTSIIIFNNVTFSNIESTNSYGLIYIYDDFNVEINNCTFENNTNFVSIYCDSYSYCNVVIKNSFFVNNDGLCLDDIRFTNGILLNDNAHASVSIINTVFVGYPYFEYDSTSNVSIDSNTYSMMVGDSDTQSCTPGQTVFVSKDRCVPFQKTK